MTANVTRSQAAAAASRRNGACSKGPRTDKGKTTAARNALKHGLFRSQAFASQELSPSVAALALELAGQAPGGDAGMLLDTVVFAAMRLEQATSIIRRLRAELDRMFVDEAFAGPRMTLLLAELVRMGRYERRFRGRRDRALRAMMKPPAGTPD